jgi:hypothetical protein
VYEAARFQVAPVAGGRSIHPDLRKCSGEIEEAFSVGTALRWSCLGHSGAVTLTTSRLHGRRPVRSGRHRVPHLRALSPEASQTGTLGERQALGGSVVGLARWAGDKAHRRSGLPNSGRTLPTVVSRALAAGSLVCRGAHDHRPPPGACLRGRPRGRLFSTIRPCSNISPPHTPAASPRSSAPAKQGSRLGHLRQYVFARSTSTSRLENHKPGSSCWQGNPAL